MKVLCILPVKDRIETTKRLVPRLRATAGHDYQLVIVLDGDQQAYEDFKAADWPGCEIIYREEVGGCWTALRDACQGREFDLVVAIGNDVIPGCDWLKRAVAVYAKHFPERSGIVLFNDGIYDGAGCGHFMAHRDLLHEYYGDDLWPLEYQYESGDAEILKRAQRQERVVLAPYAVLFHNHPLNGAPSDAGYEERAASREADAEVYEKRMGELSGTKGFGSIAIAVRAGGPVDPYFFKCYTHSITGGTRRRDAILPPVIELPHQWAATCAMNLFLQHTQCDTLLIMDDDMIFDSADIDALRDHEANWEYDLVQGLCCARKGHHSPLILRDKGNGYFQAVEPSREGGTVPVDMVGFAFTLIRRTVIEKLNDQRRPQELLVHWQDNGIGEDGNFCKRATAAGFKCAVDMDVDIGHRVMMNVHWDVKKGKAAYHTYADRAFVEAMHQVTREDAEKEAANGSESNRSGA